MYAVIRIDKNGRELVSEYETAHEAYYVFNHTAVCKGWRIQLVRGYGHKWQTIEYEK